MADLASGLQAVLQGPLQQPEVRRPPGSEGGSPRQASSDGEEPSAAAQGTGAAPRQLRRQSSPPVSLGRHDCLSVGIDFLSRTCAIHLRLQPWALAHDENRQKY